MANRLKEDEKNERIIRGLLKLPANRRCINCNSLGPQYVCTNFWTFACTNCSGIHREFTHRVKSISMAKFTSQEVSALQEGGNQRAKEIYFKEWDPQSHSLPDSSNVNRLRNFIKHVYVERRFTGERTYDKTLKGDKDNFYENGRVESYQGGPRSPPYEDTYERRYNERSSPGGRSPGYDQESRQYGDDKRSPGRPPVITDWRHEDRFGDGRRYEDQSHEGAKDLGSSRPPVVRPVRDILGENAVPLRISEPPKTNSRKVSDGSALTQRTASSSSLASSSGTPAEVKLETIKSLIDFDAEPEPPVAPALPQAQQTTVAQPSVEQPNSSDDNNWASFDVAPEEKATQAPSNVNPLESVFSQLSISASLPSHVSQVQGGSSIATPIPGSILTIPKTGDSSVSPAGPVPASFLNATAAGAATVSSISTFPSSSASVAGPGLTTVLQHQQPLFPPIVVQSSTQQFTPPGVGALNNQQWNVPPAPALQGQHSMSMPNSSHLVSKLASEIKSSVVSQASVEVKPSGRKELPEDLFTVKYSSFPAPVPGWQMGPPHGMGIYNTVPMPSFQQPSKSTNPFDIGSDPPPILIPTFPSMSSLQGSLPNVSPSGLMHPSSLGNPSVAWNPPHSSPYGSVLPPQAQPHLSIMATRPYMGQQMPTNMPMPMPLSRDQGIGSFGAEGAALGISNLDRQMTGTFSVSATSNPSSVGGNPFG